MYDSEHRHIFIHLIKTGGTSAERAYGSHGMIALNDQIAPASDYIAQMPDEWSSAEVIWALVRNPFDRFLSQHRWGLRQPGAAPWLATIQEIAPEGGHYSAGVLLPHLRQHIRRGNWLTRSQRGSMSRSLYEGLSPEDAERVHVVRLEEVAELWPTLVEDWGATEWLPAKFPQENAAPQGPLDIRTLDIEPRLVAKLAIHLRPDLDRWPEYRWGPVEWSLPKMAELYSRSGCQLEQCEAHRADLLKFFRRVFSAPPMAHGPPGPQLPP